MSYKPSKEELIAYLYGELNTEETKAIRDYIEENPEVKNELNELRSMRSVLKNWEDQEVNEPIIMLGGNPKQIDWSSTLRFLKPMASIAASLLIFFLVGKAIGTEIVYSDRTLKISFGSEENQTDTNVPVDNDLEKQYQDYRSSINQLVSNQIALNNDSIFKSIEEIERGFYASLKDNTITGNSSDLQEISAKQISEIVSELSKENQQLMIKMLESFRLQQEKYMEASFINFSNYLQEQRSKDLKLIEVSLNSFREDVNLKQNETEQIMARIIETVNEKDN
ncbi:hypothetical protein QQ008_05650 [Fulvivirgaceae bacterium BMA10]|uniref:Zinc-finger domain-containing protein n=1 Tax=Splendidivirga corallicola TaxID=3051826 RepID=A0ABT8KJE6_9BACT|nr:hypothetical protein [Fulvivirgaceae bacterium BMA10]